MCVLAMLAVAGCSNTTAPVTFDMRSVTSDGEDPFTDETFTRVRIQVAQEGLETIRVESAVDETFDLSYSIVSLSAPTRVRMQLIGDRTLHGAPPEFSPLASGGLVRFALGEPGQCERVSGFDLTSPMGAAYVPIDTFVLVAGGVDEGEGSDQVRALDLLRLAVSDLEPLPMAGPVAGTRLGASAALLIQEGGALRYDLAANPATMDRFTSLTLHDGAGPTTAVLTREDAGALAVGPGLGFSLIAPDARVITGVLQTERTSPLLVETNGALLVIGGNTTGPFVERIDVDRGTSEVVLMDGPTGPTAPTRHLTVDNGVWLWGSDGASSLLRNCPTACVLEDGPAIDSIIGSADVMGRAEGAYLAGETLWRARLVGGEPTLEMVATGDAAPMAEATVPYESDLVLLPDAMGARLCFPETLPTL